jgi:hypothetical protein
VNGARYSPGANATSAVLARVRPAITHVSITSRAEAFVVLAAVFDLLVAESLQLAVRKRHGREAMPIGGWRGATALVARRRAGRR